MGETAKIMIIAGAVLVLLGLALLVTQKPPFSGKFPGDILIKRGDFTFYFPLAASIIIISIIISLVLYLIGKFR
jgi:hypothetical protein